MKKLFSVIALLFMLYGIIARNPALLPSHSNENASDTSQIVHAFQNHQSDIQIAGSGIVIHNLADDTKGRRHQKFLLRLPSGQTLLVAHNIDLAPRVRSLHKGDNVEFSGEYKWNSKGGALHRTYRDPHGQHQGGWLKHDGKTYQ